MNLNEFIFREYDIRGKVSDDFPEEVWWKPSGHDLQTHEPVAEVLVEYFPDEQLEHDVEPVEDW